MPTVPEGSLAGLEYFWVLWQELYDAHELPRPREYWKCPVLLAIRKMLWRCPEHIPIDEFCEHLVDRLEQAVRSDLTHEIERGVLPDGWKTKIQNIDAWLTKSASNAAIDYSRGNNPGFRGKVQYRIVHLTPKPEDGSGESASVPADLLNNLPAPAHTCSDSNELLCHFFCEGLDSPLIKQCFEHLRVCASCTGLLQCLVRELGDFLRGNLRPGFVRLMDELGMRNGVRHLLLANRRSTLADLQRFECSTKPPGYPDKEIQIIVQMLRQQLVSIDQNLELIRTLRPWSSARKRNLGIRRGTPLQTLAITLSQASILLDAVTGEEPLPEYLTTSDKTTVASSNTVEVAQR